MNLHRLHRWLPGGFAMSVRTRALSLPLLALASISCGGGDQGRQASGGNEEGVTTLNTTEDGAPDDEAAERTGNDDAGGERGPPKCDVAAIPDGAAECNTGVSQECSYSWIANSTQGTVSKIDALSTIEGRRYQVTANPAPEPPRT